MNQRYVLEDLSMVMGIPDYLDAEPNTSPLEQELIQKAQQ